MIYINIFSEPSVSPQTEEKKFDATGIIVAVVLFVVLCIIAAVVIYCWRRHRQLKKAEASKQNFNESIVSRTHDGSVAAVNRLSGLVHTPEPQRVEYRRERDTNNESVNVDSVDNVYLNPTYSKPRYQVPGRSNAANGDPPVHQTVIDVRNSHVYDNPKFSREVPNHDYDNPHESQIVVDSDDPYSSLHHNASHQYKRINEVTNSRSLQEEPNTEAAVSHSDVVNKEINNVTDETDFRARLSSQKDVPSPTDNITEPNWPKDKKN